MSKADDLILANGPYPPVPAVERRLVGLTHHPTIWEAAAPMIATFPNGVRVELPAGTVLREALPPEPEDDRPTLGEQIHDEHDRATHADGSCCLCDPATTVLTERVGLPREMAPSVTAYDPNDSSWAARYTETMRVNAIQRAEIERLREQLENSATPADRAVGAAMLGSLR